MQRASLPKPPNNLLIISRNLDDVWSKPELAMTQDQMLRREPEGNWSYQYFSLIDPKSEDPSYMSITDSPYLYYVRMDGNHPGTSGSVSTKDQVRLANKIGSGFGGT
jgi:hypothetical protein